MDWIRFDGDLVVIFGFVILIVLINAIASVFRNSQRQETIRELLKSGQSLDAEVLQSLGVDGKEKGGSATAGLVLIAVAVGLVIFGYSVGDAAGDEDVGQIMTGIAAIPGLIGVVLLISGIFNRKKGE